MSRWIDNNPWLPRFIVRYIALVLTATFLFTAISTGIVLDARSSQNAISIHNSCVAVNVLLRGLQGYFRDQRLTTIHTDYSLFLNGSDDALAVLKHEQIRDYTKLIHRFKPTDCPPA